MVVALICLSVALTASVAALAVVTHLFLRHMEMAAQNASIERAELCQRIQAPALAVQQKALEGEPPVEDLPQASPWDDDRAYWDQRGIVLPEDESAVR